MKRITVVQTGGKTQTIEAESFESNGRGDLELRGEDAKLVAVVAGGHWKSVSIEPQKAEHDTKQQASR